MLKLHYALLSLKCDYTRNVTPFHVFVCLSIVDELNSSHEGGVDCVVLKRCASYDILTV